MVRSIFMPLFLLISVLVMAWRLEKFWRTLEPARRWEYKFLVVGGYLICGTLAWAASYRLTFLRLVPDHFLLAAVLVLVAWSFMCYATAHHRLLNRKMFISRKIVYSFVAPSILAVYLFALGIVSWAMRSIRAAPSFCSALAVSGSRAGCHWFICLLRQIAPPDPILYQHPFLCQQIRVSGRVVGPFPPLQGALTETDVIKALRQVLSESLYTTNLIIWLGDPAMVTELFLPMGTRTTTPMLLPPMIRWFDSSRPISISMSTIKKRTGPGKRWRKKRKDL